MGDTTTPIRIVLNLTFVNEQELLIQFESIVNAKEDKSDVKYCIVQQCTFKEIFYKQHLMQASLERKYVSAYMYGWMFGNCDDNT